MAGAAADGIGAAVGRVVRIPRRRGRVRTAISVVTPAQQQSGDQ
jgi:hypothetical protein